MNMPGCSLSAVQPVFDEFELDAPDDPTIQQRRALLGAAQQHGIDVAYRALLVWEVVDAWINTDTWAASRAFLDEHHTDLASDEAMAILADLAADGQSAAIMHHALLTLVRLGHTNRAYDAIVDPARLQAELAAARGDADPTSYRLRHDWRRRSIRRCRHRPGVLPSGTRSRLPTIWPSITISSSGPGNSHPTRFRCGWATSAPSWEPGLTARRH